MGLQGAARNSPFNRPGDTRVIALQLPQAGGYNPYVDILRGSLCIGGFDFDGVHFFRQAPRVALLHWTETYWLDGTSSTWARTRRLARRRALPILLRTLRARGFKVVWFAHNASPLNRPPTNPSPSNAKSPNIQNDSLITTREHAPIRSPPPHGTLSLTRGSQGFSMPFR
jgi:hypothetical protein